MGQEGKMGSYCLRDTEFPFGVMNTVWNYIAVVVVQHDECTRYQWIVHLKMIEMVNVMLWVFYYNKNIYYGGIKAIEDVG